MEKIQMSNGSNRLTADDRVLRTMEGQALEKTLKRHSRNKQLFILLAFFALSLNLRAPITSLPPIIQDLTAIFHISGGFAGFLTSIPVLCFGLLTPLIGFLMKNIRLETTIFLTLAGIALGTFVRSAGGINAIVAGTAIIGVALTAGNIAGLLVIGREFPHRINAMTGLYVFGMSWGAMGTMALTAPLSLAIGWRPALALPALLALVAIALWLAVGFHEYKENRILMQLQNHPEEPAATSSQTEAATASSASSVMKLPLVWVLSAAFAAHTFLFYGITAWLPVYLTQSIQMSDATAGVAASLFQFMGLLGCFGLPLLAGTQRFSTRILFLIVTLSWAATAVGLWTAPRLWGVWVAFGGIGGGGGFTVIFSMIMRYAKDLNENRSISTVVQTMGYIIAAISPFAIGHLHDASGNWQGSMALLSGAALLMILCGLIAPKYAKQ